VYNAVYGTLLINNGNLRNTSGTSSAVDSEKDAIETLLVSNDAYLNQFNVQNAALTTLINGSVASTVASLQSRVTSLTQDKNQLFTDLNKCRTDEAKLQAAVTSAQATRDAALASVVAVCPDFVP
jgi:peptidoglycan hydrolase CwlO-like protein